MHKGKDGKVQKLFMEEEIDNPLCKSTAVRNREKAVGGGG